MTYRNSRFTKRNYDCTNVVAVEAASVPNLPGYPAEMWAPCDASELRGLTHLWTQAGVRFYGYL